MLTLFFSGKLICQCISAGYVFFVDVPTKFVGPAKKYDVSSSAPSSVAHKYLQVALVADENVAAKHGNHTADFLLVLANIVSSVFTVAKSIVCLPYSASSIHRYSSRHKEKTFFIWGGGWARTLEGSKSLEGVLSKMFAD